MKNSKDYRLPPPSTFIPPELLKIKKKSGRPAKKVNAMTGKPIEETVVVSHTEVLSPLNLPKYTLTLNAAGNLTIGEGYTMLEALKNLKKPDKITTKATIRIEHDGKAKELYYTPVKLKRVFYPIAQVLLAKSFAANLK